MQIPYACHDANKDAKSGKILRIFHNQVRAVTHLPANAFTTLSAFVSFAEGYLGLWPTTTLWSKYFQFRKQVIPNPADPDTPKEMTQTGAATVTPRRTSIFPRINGLESCRKWQPIGKGSRFLFQTDWFNFKR